MGRSVHPPTPDPSTSQRSGGQAGSPEHNNYFILFGRLAIWLLRLRGRGVL